MQRIGIIGGSGLYEMEGLKIVEEKLIQTPFGDPSDRYIIGEFQGKQVVFLPRHGMGHRLLPSEINYRANIFGMKSLGVEWILSVSAVGSFKKELKPCDVVLIDQFLDRTNQARKSTFFGDGLVAHVGFSHPVCEDLRMILLNESRTIQDTTFHNGGTYVNMEGPPFSTRAESLLYKSWGMDVIGMTNLQEAKLAREAEICFATMAMVTDWDCWIEGDPEAAVSVEMVLENSRKNVSVAKELIRKAIPKIPTDRHCGCSNALQNAVMTDPAVIPAKTKERLDIIIGKYI